MKLAFLSNCHCGARIRINVNGIIAKRISNLDVKLGMSNYSLLDVKPNVVNDGRLSRRVQGGNVFSFGRANGGVERWGKYDGYRQTDDDRSSRSCCGALRVHSFDVRTPAEYSTA